MADRKAKYVVCDDETVHYECATEKEAIRVAKGYFSAGSVTTRVCKVVKEPIVKWEE